MNTQAWNGAIQGMTKAANHAECINEDWKDRALKFFLDFAKKQDGYPFMVCEVIASAGPDLAAPDERAWGYVAQRAARQGLVVRCGYSLRTMGKSHSSPRAVWKLA